MRSQRMLLLLVAAVVGMIAPSAASATPPSPAPTTTQLLTGLEGGSGSTVGPGGALYVTESAAGRISRVDPRTGEITTFASGLPQSIIGIGGTTDVAFIGGTAYALVTVVGPDVGGSDVVGIYRIDGPDSFTVIADIGAFALEQSAGISGRHPDRSPVRARDLPRRVPGHRWAPQPGLPGHPRRRGQRADRSSATSSRPGWRQGATRSTWPRPDPSPTIRRTARWCRSGRSHPAPPSWPPVPRSSSTSSSAAVAICSPSRRASFGGGPPGAPAAPNTGSLVKVNANGTFSGVGDDLGPADLGRVHQEHRVRRHPHRGDLEDRERLGSAPRRVALTASASEAATPDAARAALRGRLRPRAGVGQRGPASVTREVSLSIAKRGHGVPEY